MPTSPKARPPAPITVNSFPISPSKSSSSALRKSTDNLTSRAGSPRTMSIAAGLGHASVIAGMDIHSSHNFVDLGDAALDDATARKLDRGYDGELEREEGDETLGVDEQAQRDYLSGPTSSPIFTPLRRPSPLLKVRSQVGAEEVHLDIPFTSSELPSPAISTTTNGSNGTSPFEPQDFLFGNASSFDYDSTPSRPRPRAYTLSHSAFGSFGTFPSTARAGPVPAPTLWSRVRLFFLQLVSNSASAGFLVLIVVWALSARGLNASLNYILGRNSKRSRRDWDTDEMEAKYSREKVVKDIKYYARNCGFDIEEQVVETKDGYLLKVFRVEVLGRKSKVHSDGRKGFPVLIQHGLFQSCGSFITSEERSLAFWLAEHGCIFLSSRFVLADTDPSKHLSDYQVYLGNNRGVFDMGHVALKRGDPRFWDFNIKELALYDLPALVDHVRRDTGYDKIAFIGHSQGNATMFCSLAQGMVPELGEKMSLFIALAPAVYAGPLTTGFPFTALKGMKWRTWRRVFGILDFIPLMRISYNLTPSKPFGLLGYQMFAFLFNWTDTNWLLRRKPKMFRFTPSPVSSASIFWWTGLSLLFVIEQQTFTHALDLQDTEASLLAVAFLTQTSTSGSTNVFRHSRFISAPPSQA
ncbi:lysosomal acid lipase/cholesteryl ester hydrolase, partial [Phenoliferia sp. Uapishka_3]